VAFQKPLFPLTFALGNDINRREQTQRHEARSRDPLRKRLGDCSQQSPTKDQAQGQPTGLYLFVDFNGGKDRIGCHENSSTLNTP
jgi:hypothetical protein